MTCEVYVQLAKAKYESKGGSYESVKKRMYPFRPLEQNGIVCFVMNIDEDFETARKKHEEFEHASLVHEEAEKWGFAPAGVNPFTIVVSERSKDECFDLIKKWLPYCCPYAEDRCLAEQRVVQLLAKCEWDDIACLQVMAFDHGIVSMIYISKSDVTPEITQALDSIAEIAPDGCIVVDIFKGCLKKLDEIPST